MDGISSGFSQHTVNGHGLKTIHQSRPVTELILLVVMCFPLRELHVW